MEPLKETKQKPTIRCKKVQTAKVSTPPRERKGGEGGGKEGGGEREGKGARKRRKGACTFTYRRETLFPKLQHKTKILHGQKH